MDIFLLVTSFIIVFALEIKVEHAKESIAKGFSKILNPASGVFFAIGMGMGLGFGVFSTYGPVYLQEEMGASSAMIGRVP